MLLCVGEWSKLKLVADEDVLAATSQPEKETVETAAELSSGWDRIVLS